MNTSSLGSPGRLPLLLCAAALLSLSLALGILQNGQSPLWLLGLLSLSIGTMVVRHAQRSSAAVSHSLQGALLLAGGILCVALATALLNAAQLLPIGSAELSQRAQGLMHALIVLVFANLIPKAQAPSCSQHLLRFSGWVLVLAALVYALAWLLAPLEMARLISTSALASALLLVVLRWALGASRGARS